MKQSFLKPHQIEGAKFLKSKGATKRELAVIFGVGQTTIWDNVYRLKLVKEFNNKEKCKICKFPFKEEVEIVNNIKRVPLQYKIGDKCLDCIMEKRGLTCKDMEVYGIVIV